VRRRLGLALVALAGCGPSDAQPAAETAGATAAARPAQPSSEPDTAPAAFGAYAEANLIIISLDTLRADATSFGGGAPNISPALAAFAAEGTVFEHARAQAPHTAPSHMSLFTSALPAVHEVQNVSFRKDADAGEKAIIVPARPDVPTLAEVLKAAGFRTIGHTDGGNLNPPHGFARGFDTYTYDLQGARDKVALGVQELQALAAQDGGRSFLFWHTYQIHAPYCPPQSYIQNWAPKSYAGPLRERLDLLGDMSFKERFGAMKTLFWRDRESFSWPEAAFLHGLYMGGIRYTDDELGALFRAMGETGASGNSVVVLLSDHGEEFFEHGAWQHEQLYEECLRVPLVVRLPDRRGAGQRLRTPVALMDVMPTVLELLGIDPARLALPGRVRSGGRSLASSLLTGSEPRPLPVISELIDDRGEGGNYERIVAIHSNGLKYVHDRVRVETDAERHALRGPGGKPLPLRQLFDLGKDPDEQANLAASGAAALKEFDRLYAAYEAVVKLEQASEGDRAPIEVSPEMEEQLRQLGYTR